MELVGVINLNAVGPKKDKAAAYCPWSQDRRGKCISPIEPRKARRASIKIKDFGLF
jgi:hypothetical protein